MNRKIIYFMLMLILSVGAIWADSNGVWHLAKDVRPGIFGSDETGYLDGTFGFIHPVNFAKNVYLMENVGIGTYNPSSKLHVEGNVRWSGTLEGGTVPWARLINIPSATTSQAGIVQLSSSTSSTSTSLAATPWAVKAAYDLAASKAATGSCGTNQAIRVAGTSGVTCVNLPSGTVTRISTGTGINGGPITSSGTISLDTSYTDNRYVNKAGDTMTGNLWFSGGTRYIGTSDNNQFRIRTNNADRITITNTGNVGIGTNSPSAKLHVAGNIIASNPTASSHVATKAYVDSQMGGEVYVSNVVIYERSTSVCYASLSATSDRHSFCVIGQTPYGQHSYIKVEPSSSSDSNGKRIFSMNANACSGRVSMVCYD